MGYIRSVCIQIDFLDALLSSGKEEQAPVRVVIVSGVRRGRASDWKR